MWVSGLEGLSFSAFVGNSELRLFGFDAEGGGFDEIRTADGQDFTAYGPPANAFDTVLVAGLVEQDETDGVGYELYELMSDGSLTLFADILQGPQHSHIGLDTMFSFGEDESYFITTIVPSVSVPFVIFQDGQSGPLADLFSDIDTFTGFRLPIVPNGEMTFDDTVFFLAEANGEDHVAWRLDVEAETYEALIQFDRDVVTFDFVDMYLIDDQVLARIDTFLHGTELWTLSENDIWELVDTLAPGASSSSPRFEFEFEDILYFSAVGDLGRELYRFDEVENEFTLVMDLGPGLNNGILSLRTFEYDGVLYLDTVRYDTLFRLDDNGQIVEVVEFIPGRTDKFPRNLVNFDTGEVVGFLSGGDGEGADYIIRDGVLSEIQAPEGTVRYLGIYGGNLLIEVKADGQSEFEVFVLGDNGEWQSIFTAPDVVSVGRMVSIAQLDDGRDVYFGDDSSETVESPTSGGIVYAHGGTDELLGSDEADAFFGGAGRDSLSGMAGDDVLEGGNGADAIDGGAGEDEVFGGRGDDVLFGGDGGDVLRGGDEDDTVSGDGAHDVLEGNAGQDTLFGGAGHDELIGGAGRDELFGGAGRDALFGDETRDTLHGGDGHDALFGGAGRDELFGGAGRDALFGGRADDTLTGGAGNDVFVFEDSFGNDVITDFAASNAEDIDLSAVTEILDFNDLLNNHMIQVGADVVIGDGTGNTITIQNFSIDDLTAGDFLF